MQIIYFIFSVIVGQCIEYKIIHGMSDVKFTECLFELAIESRWGRDFPHLSRPALGPTQPPVQWVPVLSRGKERPGRDADPSPPSSAVVKKE
jgi:hypothetical protein